MNNFTKFEETLISVSVGMRLLVLSAQRSELEKRNWEGKLCTATVRSKFSLRKNPADML